MIIKATRRIQSALLGLTLTCWLGLATGLHAQPTGTNQIAFTDFDTSAPGWDYGYFYSWGWDAGGQYTNGTYLVDRVFVDPLIDPSDGPIVIRYMFTNAPFFDLITTNPSAGYGTGFGGPQIWALDPSVFNSVQLSDYLFTFDSRVEGLEAGQMTGNCEMQVQIFANGGPKVLQKNLAYNPGSNWSSFSFTLEDGSFADGTTLASFTNNLATISGIQFNVNLNMPNPQFGWDDYNVVEVDNIELSVIQYAGPPPPPPPYVDYTMLDWNLDNNPLWYGYGGYAWSQNANMPVATYDIAAAGYGLGGSNAWILTMDNSSMTNGAPQWAGCGTGGGGPVDYSYFNTNDLKSYIISFEARALGLAPDRESTVCRLQLFLDVPDDTLQPPDANTDNDLLLQLDIDVVAGTNFQANTYSLNQGAAGGQTSKTNFALYFNLINELRTQWQIENAQSVPDWEYDANNVLIIDNIRLSRRYIGCPPLSIQTVGSDIVVSWDPPSSGGTKLLTGASLGTISNVVTGATSPYTNSLSGGPQYYRTEWVPPP